VCPVYRQIGGHAYGYTYPGPIGILLTAMLKGNGSVRELAHASSLCGACKDVCPVRIDIPRMLVELREHLDREKIAPWTERVVFRALRRLLLSPTASRLSARVGRWAQRPFIRQGRLRSLPLVFGQWTKTRDLPPVAARTFREQWKELR
jgi:L-lactate dehydrogenase complex protein LldF